MHAKLPRGLIPSRDFWAPQSMTCMVFAAKGETYPGNGPAEYLILTNKQPRIRKMIKLSFVGRRHASNLTKFRAVLRNFRCRGRIEGCPGGTARQDKTRQYKTRQDKTRKDQTRQDKTRQDKTRQDKTRRDETRQDETRQDKTRQDKTRLSLYSIPKHLGVLLLRKAQYPTSSFTDGRISHTGGQQSGSQYATQGNQQLGNTNPTKGKSAIGEQISHTGGIGKSNRTVRNYKKEGEKTEQKGTM